MMNKMKAISRREFFQVAGVALFVATLPAMGGGRHRRGPKKFCIEALHPAGDLTPKQMAFIRRARFDTAADAMRAVASRGMRARIYQK